MRHRRPAAVARHGARPSEERSLTEAPPRLVGCFASADAPLDPPFPEIALVGRSNVGKSSLLNALAGRRIARVSGAPGKTRALNVYVLPLHHAVYFLDLPGYGYARAGRDERAGFRRLIAGALERPRLAGGLWLLDIRREPSSDDRSMQELFAARGTRVLAAVTKGDKLAGEGRGRRERELATALGLDEDQVIVTSARSGEGVTELRQAIAALVAGAAA